MKKMLAVILTLVLTITCVQVTLLPTAVSAAEIFSHTFTDANEGISPYTTTGSNPSDGTINVTLGEISEGDNAMKIEATGTTLSSTTKYIYYGPNPALTATGSYTLSFDFMATGVAENANLLNIVLKSSGVFFTKFDKIQTSGTFGEATWEKDTLYNVAYSVDCENLTYAVTLTNKATNQVQTVRAGVLDQATQPLTNFEKIEIHPLAAGTIWLDNITFNAVQGVAILSPTESEIVDSTEAFTVSGTLAEGYSSAKILIDGTEKATISAGQESFTATVDASAYNFGSHTISLVAEYTDGTKTFSEDVIFTDKDENTLMNGLPVTNSTDYSNKCFSFSMPGGLTATNDGSAIVLTSEGSGYRRLRFDSNVISGDVAYLEVTGKFSNASASKLWCYINNANRTEYFINSSRFAGTGGSVAANTEYKMGVLFDFNTKKYEYYLGGLAGTKIYTGNITVDSMRQFYFEWKGTEAASGSTFTILNAKFVQWFTAPYAASLSYVKDGNEFSDANWVDGKMPAIADSLKINLNRSADENYATTEGNVILNKITDEGATAVEAAATQDGASIIVTPEGGFDTNAKYQVLMSNMTYESGIEAKKPLEINFGTIGVFDIISPVSDAVYEDAAKVTLSASIPTGHEDYVFILDGEEIDSSKITNVGEVYSADIAWADIPLGNHKFEVKATYPGGIQTDSVSFVTERKLNVLEITSDARAVAGEGVDGASDSGLSIKPSYDCIVIEDGTQPLVNQTFGNFTGKDLMLEFDIKRPANTTLKLESYHKTGTVTLFYPIMPASNKIFINTNGAVVGTSTICPANEWHKIRLVLYFSTYDATAGTCYQEVYFDGKCIKSGTFTVGSNDYSKVKLLANAKPSGIKFDNIYIGEYVKNPKVSAVAYNITGDEYTDAESSAISAASAKVKLTLDKAFDSISVADVKVNGVAASDVSADGNDVIITLPALPKNSAVKVQFAETLTVGGVAMAKTLQHTLYTNNDSTDFVGAFNITKADNSASASITITKSTISESEFGENVTLMIAAYSGNKLTAISFRTPELQDGDNPLSISLDALNGGTTVKAFVWDSFSTLTPVATAEK